MKKTKLYLDTSVPSFLLADDSPEKREVTIQFWDTLKMGLYDIVISHILLAEISRRGVNGINRMLGFKELEILTPQSWIQEDNYVC